MVPNEYELVVEVVGPRLAIVGGEEETRANTFWAVNDGCQDARRKNQRWGLLVKTGGAQVEERAADVWLYNLGNGTAQVVDVVANAEGAPPEEGAERTTPIPAWGEKDVRPMSEWAEPYPRSGDGDPGDGDADGLLARIEALEAQVTAIGAEVDDLAARYETLASDTDALDTRIAALEAALAQPLHAHGPVDLPIVLESLTSLRCIGDIDVAVKPGTATPPNPSSETPPGNLATLAILKRLLGRDDEVEP